MINSFRNNRYYINNWPLLLIKLIMFLHIPFFAYGNHFGSIFFSFLPDMAVRQFFSKTENLCMTPFSQCPCFTGLGLLWWWSEHSKNSFWYTIECLFSSRSFLSVFQKQLRQKYYSLFYVSSKIKSRDKRFYKEKSSQFFNRHFSLINNSIVIHWFILVLIICRIKTKYCVKTSDNNF